MAADHPGNPNDKPPHGAGSTATNVGTGTSADSKAADAKASDAGDSSGDTSGDAANEVSADNLSDEVAKKYDPERLLQMVSKRAGKGERLAQHQQAKYERMIGGHLGLGKVNFDKVRIYTGEFAEEFTKKQNAHAVTIGDTGMVLMGRSPTRSMATYAGEALLAHELTHVAQAQKGLWAAGKGGSPTPAEKKDIEEQAHKVEQAAGGVANQAELARQRAQQIKEQEAKILERVLELCGESMLVSQLRSGPERRRG